MKDVPKITPIYYPSRVAPLPEDRTAAPDAAEGEFAHGDLQSEARKIQSDARVRSYFGLAQEEVIPFPTLIKLDKRPAKVPMDLALAIREVKVRACFWRLLDLFWFAFQVAFLGIRIAIPTIVKLNVVVSCIEMESI